MRGPGLATSLDGRIESLPMAWNAYAVRAMGMTIISAEALLKKALPLGTSFNVKQSFFLHPDFYTLVTAS